MSLRFFLDNLWRWSSSVPEKKLTEVKDLTREGLYQSEWSADFERLMRNRLVLGAYRYDKLVPGKRGDIRRIYSAISRLNKYIETGNQEHLVDAANLCMCEFIEPSFDKSKLEAIDDGEHWTD